MIKRINELYFLLISAFHLYILGAIYVLKELNRKFQFYYTVRHLTPYDSDIPQSLNGQTAIITGGSRGIGLETAKVLLEKGCHVIIGSSSNRQFTDSLLQQLSNDYNPNKINIYSLDLSSLESVHQFVSRVHESHSNVNILINNAAVMFVPKCITRDGFESHFQINYIGHFLLQWSLIPLMVESAQRCGNKSRIVNVASSTHFARDLRLNDLQSLQLYSPFHAYAQSKLAQIMQTYSLHDWLMLNQQYGDHVTVNSLHPGVALTELYENVFWVKMLPSLASVMFRTPKEGAETIIYAALSKELNNVGGKYLEDCAIARSSTFSYNKQYQRQLWVQTWKSLQQWITDINDMPDPLLTDF